MSDGGWGMIQRAGIPKITITDRPGHFDLNRSGDEFRSQVNLGKVGEKTTDK